MNLKDKIIDLFCEIASIPRTSGNTSRIVNNLKRFAQQQGLLAQNLGGNLIITIPATSGFEDKEALIIQCNCDMIGVKSSQSNLDFLNDPIPIMVSSDKKYLKSENNNIGADSSIGLIYTYLLMLEYHDFDHPKIYIVITRDKEFNFQGARSLDLHTLDDAKKLIQIAPQSEGFLLIGSAGGQEIIGNYQYDSNLSLGYIYEISISNLRGGRDDGKMMQLHGGQAAKLLAQVIAHIFLIHPVQLISFDCPGTNNSITSQGKATFISSGNKKELTDAALEILKLIAACYGPNENNININLAVRQDAEKLTAITQESTLNLLFNIINVPYGIVNTINGFPTSSINLSSCIVCNNKLTLKEYIKYSDDNFGNLVRNKVLQHFQMTGAKISVSDPEPRWKRKENTKLQKLALDIWNSLGYSPLKPVNIYDNSELGVIIEKRPDLECIAFGPTILDFQTANERVDLESTIKVYNYLKELIKGMIK